MNDLLNGTLDGMTPDDASLDLGSFDGFDPFAEEETSVDAPIAETEDGAEPTEPTATVESEGTNVTPLPKSQETPLSPEPSAEPAASAPQQKKTPTPAAKPTANPLQQAIEEAAVKDVKQAATPVFSRPPVFSHGGVNEDITDPKITFDQLREEKSRDFSELEDAGKVSWTVEYGKTTRPIVKPKSDVIFAVKKEIESSKAFLDTIKKDGTKGLVCKVKPRITAQKKGIASYKGIFTSLEEVEQAQKPISILPARDGKVYEIRRTPLGTFIAPTENVEELSEVRAGFRPALPLIPRSLLHQIIGFFRYFMREDHPLEALAHIYWDKEQEEYHVVVPTQWVTATSVDSVLSEEDVLDEERFLHYADIHSHNRMEARFSGTDDRDEKATRVYLVVGRLERFFPNITARISCNGRFVPVPVEQIFAPADQSFPAEWAEKVHFNRREVA